MFLQKFFESLEMGTLPEECIEEVERVKKCILLRTDPDVVPSEDVEAARAWATASGFEVFANFPCGWRPLYEAPVKLSYDIASFDFQSLLREMFSCPEGVSLDNLHDAVWPPEYEACPPLHKGMLLANLPVSQDKSKAKRKREWAASPAYLRFLQMYKAFVLDEILPAIAVAAGIETQAFEAVVQSIPVIRVVMPSPHYATVMHRDSEYGHVAGEINIWVPLSQVFGSNSLFVESFPDRGDFHPLEGSMGDAFVWWGNQCRHYAEANQTNATRVSFDFRLIPKRFWDASEVAGSQTEAIQKQKFLHDGDLRLGSYYYLVTQSIM